MEPSKYSEHWRIVRETRDCAVYDKGLKGMLESATCAAEHNLATELMINGKSPKLITKIDELTKGEPK
jgi:hypothetical protein